MTNRELSNAFFGISMAIFLILFFILGVSELVKMTRRGKIEQIKKYEKCLKMTKNNQSFCVETIDSENWQKTKNKMIECLKVTKNNAAFCYEEIIYN